jgi:spore germination protein KB
MDKMESTTNNKISIRQMIIIFLISAGSPIIRIIPRHCADIAKQASWLTPIVAIIPFILILYVLNILLTKSKKESLEEVFSYILGKFLGKTLIIIYTLWIFCILGLYVRYFSDRFTATILIFTPVKFFSITILLLVYVIVRNEIKFFARYLEYFTIIYVLFLIGIFFIGLPDIQLSNLYPVFAKDIKPVIISTYPLLGIFAYITFMFFLGDSISNKEAFKKHFKRLCCILVPSCLLVILLTVGIFGYSLTKQFNLPFFVFFKNIKILSIIERIEAVFISFWMVTDLAIIVFFMYIITKLIKYIFNLKSTKEIVTPVISIVYIFSQFISLSSFELANFSDYIFLPFNVILGFVIPIIIFFVGKIRKLI